VSFTVRAIRTRRPVLLALAVVMLVVAMTSGAAVASTPATKPTVVLVHGAFADASGWSAVTERLQRRGYTVVAPPNPLRGVASDAAYLRSFLSTISGPIVLAGHSYGGVVITNAATGNPNVKALVYVAAYAPDAGETIGGLGAKVPGGLIGPATLTLLPFPAPDGSIATEGIITPSVFHDIFAADLPESTTAVMASQQRPAALQTLGEPSGTPAWRTIPSWYEVPGADLAIGTELERFMAKRMHATTVEVPGASHVVMMSHPQETTRLILDAAGDGRGDDDHEGRAARSHPRSRHGLHRAPRRTAR
jgi:pimeloyl-ACP methyl ester carboxylesterase